MRISPKTAGRILITPVWIVVVGMASIALMRVVAFDRVRPFMLVNSYTLWIYLPAYAIAISATCFRARALATVAWALVVVHLMWVLPPLFRTHPIPAAAVHAPHLRVVSANLLFDNDRHAAYVAELAHDDAGVMVLEEVTPAWWTAIEGSALATTLPHHAEVLRRDPGGMAILSRYPLRDVAVHDVGGWPLISASITVGGATVHLAGVHTAAPLETFRHNRLQQRIIDDVVRGMPRPRLVAGDFNTTPYNRWYGELLGLGLREAHEAVGRSWATTWPNGKHLVPAVRLDHVFVDPTIVPLRASEGRGPGSDHRPIVVDLAVMR